MTALRRARLETPLWLRWQGACLGGATLSYWRGRLRAVTDHTASR
jgi:hypothetical protein